MLDESLLHCPQIGPARLAKLHEAGIRTWQQLINRSEELASGIRAPIIDEALRCQSALEKNDIGYFVDKLATKDRWRILSHFLHDVSFFDIETAGLEYDDPITMIACWHAGEVHTFVEHENLDDFLNLLDDVKLLSSFNGSTFDVPRVLDAFHIPALPCPHLDLRWLCYHQQLRGGLKEIAYRLNIRRPTDLQHVTGEQAIRLWARWEHFQDAAAREELIRYCAADVLLLVVLAEKLVGRETLSSTIWSKLPGGDAPKSRQPAVVDDTPANNFGDASPRVLRGWRSRAG